MTFTSNPLLMFRQFICSLFAAAGLTALASAGLFWLGMQSVTPIYCIAALALLSCMVYVAVRGRVRVEITDEEVAIFRPLKMALRFPRSQFTFSSRVVSHSVNLIPVDTERILIAHNEDEAHETVLANLSKKPFDTIMAALLKDRILAAAATAPTMDEPIAAHFAVPKENMLGDFRRLIRIFAIGGLVLSFGLVGFIGYMLAKVNSNVPAAPMLAKAIGFCLLMFGGFAIPILMTYRKRERGIPAAVAIAADALDIGEERFTFGEIRRIVATPPDYTMGDFVATRTVTIWTDRGKTPFNFGVRTAGGVWKTVFEEYGDLCLTLEQAAARHGFEFVYDL